MKRALLVAALLLSSFLGGGVAQTISGGGFAAPVGALPQTLFLGQAAIAVPTWLDSVYGFNNSSDMSKARTALLSISPNGQWGAVFATRASDHGSFGYPASHIDVCEVDVDISTWCNYQQGEFPTTGATTVPRLMNEASIHNLQTPVTTIDPFTTNVAGGTVNYRPDCGVGVGATGGNNNCGVAIQIINNGAKYSNPPIQIANNSVDTSSDPNPPAIGMPVGYSLAGYVSAGVIGFRVFGGAGSPAGTVSCASRCLYIRTDGGSGSTLYVNETGGGTSGWAAK